MNAMPSPLRQTRAFSIVEVLIIVVTVILLATLALQFRPARARPATIRGTSRTPGAD